MDLHIEYLKCHHGIDKRHFCAQCHDEKERINALYNHTAHLIPSRIPIRKGCPNSPNPCFCSGVCHEIVGYRDRMPHEFNGGMPRLSTPLLSEEDVKNLDNDI